MKKQQEIVSEISFQIENFTKEPPKDVSSMQMIAIEAKLHDIRRAVMDLLEDEGSPEIDDMLKAYHEQVKELTHGQA